MKNIVPEDLLLPNGNPDVSLPRQPIDLGSVLVSILFRTGDSAKA